MVVLVGGQTQGAADTIAAVAIADARSAASKHCVHGPANRTGFPLRCDLSDDDFEDPAEILPELKSCGQELVENGIDPQYFVTSALVQDTEALRKKLGAEQLNLYGISYGSRLALAYMQAHPERVRSAILDGVAPSKLWEPTSVRTLSAWRLIRDCASDSVCNQHSRAEPTLTSVWETLREPQTRKLPNSHTYQWSGVSSIKHFKAALTSCSTTVSSQPSFPMCQFGRPRRLATMLVHTEHNIADSVSWEMYLSVVCSEDEHQLPQADTTTTESGETEQVTENQVHSIPQVFGKKVSEDLKQMCSVWPHQDVPTAAYKAMSTPTLLMSGTLDPATPPDNTDSLKPLLSAHTEVIFSGTGHNTLRTQCALSLFEDFLKQPSTELDTQCASALKRPAFLLSPSGTAP